MHVGTKRGVVFDDFGNLISHRTLLKIVFNPMLRKFGFHIVSMVDTDTGVFEGYRIRRYQPHG